jgi:hypothetical protein
MTVGEIETRVDLSFSRYEITRGTVLYRNVLIGPYLRISWSHIEDVIAILKIERIHEKERC